ncbi:DUF3019 domain-containing protein [Thalassotalea mangrovi]|uniref:DUF3019 domain-containing protein n=1 Tax=Thalassotalea mangrovi TaxID=2572245 RepID=A0A4U1BAA1_9GAMM|nr:DUF3019 domain-containing protein [Thalassotalea mangrovi]TKB47456.1 DUF3019 domain-containing protein [Thalassotalea mangrovi]
MTFKLMIVRLGSMFICALSGAFAQAQEVSDVSTQISEINILPEICVRNQNNAQCQFKLDVDLQLTAKMDVCLVIEALRIRQCQAQVEKARFQRVLTINETVTIDIVEEHTNQVLYTSVLKLAEFKPVNLRPRRNLGWIF